VSEPDGLYGLNERVAALERRVKELAEAHRFLKDRYWRHSHWPTGQVPPESPEETVTGATEPAPKKEAKKDG